MALIKQYVNLPASTIDTHGDRRSLVVTPSLMSNVAPGDRVEWWIERDPGNMGLEYQSLTQRTRLDNAMPTVGTTLGADHFFRNAITFTQVGGDKYVVKSSREGNRGAFRATDQYETWRKLYYTVWYSHDESLARFNNVKGRWHAAFAKCFIELESKGLNTTLGTVTEARVDYRSLGSGVNDWPFMNGGPNALMSLRAYGGPATAGTLTDKPLHMALLLVPQGYFTALERMTFDPTTTVVGSTPTYRRVFPDPMNGGNWLWTAQASWGTAGATDVKSYMTYTAGTPTNINWDLQGLPGLTTHLATPGNTFRLDFSFIYKSAIGGYSFGNFSVVLCTGWAEELTLQALSHETGHAAGQALQTEPLYDPGSGAALTTVDTNSRWYNDPYGGQGPHCNLNALLTPDPSTTSGQRYVWNGGGNMCVMYHQLHSNADPDVFCPFCEPRIKRRDLRSPTGAAGTWNDFG
jgi:hypothetical protein